jgi:hypothetical protein
MPFCSGGSRRDPVLIQMPTETERTCCITSVNIRRPFGNTSLRILRVSLRLIWISGLRVSGCGFPIADFPRRHPGAGDQSEMPSTQGTNH